MPQSLDADLYAHHWSFQWMVFFLFWLPIVLGATAVLTGLQYWVFQIYRKCKT